MKRAALLLLLMMLLPLAGFAAEPPNAKDEREKQIYALIKELQAQQALIAQNQVTIEEKLATVSEAVRVARIFAARGH